jgi:urease accessory protein
LKLTTQSKQPMLTPIALLKLLNLASPALPIGAYAYSQGLEWAIDKGGIDTPDAIQDWIHNVLAESICHTDLPAMKRLYAAFETADIARIHYWNQWLLACRETQELTEEDRATGKALLRLLRQQDIIAEFLAAENHVSLVTAWSFAAHFWNIPIDYAALGYCWSWVENQIAVACKTMPLAQTPAQNILAKLMPVIRQVVTTGLSLSDNNMGQSLPGWVMASAHHETQYSRLFRS